MHKVWGFLAVLTLAVLTAVPAFAAAAGGSLLSHPEKLTLTENGRVVVMTTGERVTVALGGPPPDWTVQAENQDVIRRLPNFAMVRGAQGIYEAKAPGTTTLTATGTYPCQFTPISCKIAVPMFRVTIVVEPARTATVTFRVAADGPVFISSDNRSFAPAQALAQELGVGAEAVRQDGGTVTLTMGETAVKAQVGSKRLLLNDTVIDMDVDPVERDGVIYLPIRWVAEALGYRVGWDGATRTVTTGP